MPITYTNAKGKTYYLHQGTTKTGKPKYHFSMQSNGALAEYLNYPPCLTSETIRSVSNFSWTISWLMTLGSCRDRCVGGVIVEGCW